jgi:F0F1-type ATP synthase assembly protein I
MLLSFVKKYQRNLIGIVIGAIAGWLYWHFVGCSSGTCAITSKPINSSLYGALMGYLIAGMFQKDVK